MRFCDLKRKKSKEGRKEGRTKERKEGKNTVQQGKLHVQKAKQQKQLKQITARVKTSICHRETKSQGLLLSVFVHLSLPITPGDWPGLMRDQNICTTNATTHCSHLYARQNVKTVFFLGHPKFKRAARPQLVGDERAWLDRCLASVLDDVLVPFSVGVRCDTIGRLGGGLNRIFFLSPYFILHLPRHAIL